MKFSTVLLLLLLSTLGYSQKLALYDLSCEHKINPVGIDIKEPRLSWKIKGEGKNIVQGAYSIRVAGSPAFSKNTIVWESGKVNSSESNLVAYGGPALQSTKRYYWQVMIWDKNQKASEWSTAAYWEMGILTSEEWKAKWIEPLQDSAANGPALTVRKNFPVSKNISRARAYATAHGLYELHINGKKVGDEVFTPGWTAYQKRLQYQVYDITSLLTKGENTVGAMLGDGWYKGSLAWESNWGIYGKKIGLLCQLVIEYTDGTKETIVTDDSWKGSKDGPITMNSIYDGENYNALKTLTGWDKPGYDASNWKNVKVADHGVAELVSTETVPVKKIQELKPVKILKTPKGTVVADMGQNMVGWIRLTVQGSPGTTVTIRHAEVLDKYGEFYTENLRDADATLRYTLKGQGMETYEPSFTFMGFRYVAIEGFPGELKPENLTGIVIHSDMKPTGTFECSNPLINQLQKNILWGQKGNFLDVPTDCPQRDERLGWTGDAQAFCRTAAFNMDVAAFFSKWLKDLSADQGKDGKIPYVIPDVLRGNSTSAGWGDVVTIAPWTMYQVFGDKRFLENQYESMKAYVDYIRSKTGFGFIWRGGSIFGDWLYYKPRMESHGEPDGYTDPDMIATMFYAYSTNLLAKTAQVLGKAEDEKQYRELFENIKKAFINEYTTATGRISSESQTAYVLALHFDLLTEELKRNAIQHLVNDIKKRRNHLSTGFLGTPYLCHVLASNGQLQVGYDLLLQETYPSWLYPVKMGATTIWERWDGQKTDSTFQDKHMNSFNHYAYGAIGDWMYRVVAGIEIGSPGYKHILIQPKPDRRLSFARATFESAYGKIESGWESNNGTLTVNVTIPPNTTATITLPATSLDKVREGGKPLAETNRTAKQNGSDVVLEVGSGKYTFTYNSSIAVSISKESPPNLYNFLTILQRRKKIHC